MCTLLSSTNWYLYAEDGSGAPSFWNLHGRKRSLNSMARVQLLIEDPGNRLTLRAMLEAEGCAIEGERADVVITDAVAAAVAASRERPTLLLARVGEVRDAVAAMRQGVFGYILMPFQPGEAMLMVQRALEWKKGFADGETEPASEDGSGSIEDSESRLILDTLRRCKNNQTEAARRLGIARNTLWRKLKRIRASRSRTGPT